METRDDEALEDNKTAQEETSKDGAPVSTDAPARPSTNSALGVDLAIMELVKSDLTQRVLVGRNWGPKTSSLELVERACKEWLEEYVAEPEKPEDLCEECGGGARHTSDCSTMKRKQR